jgi:hypothetical protein
MIRRGDQQQRVIVVLGWLDELKERMALATRKRAMRQEGRRWKEDGGRKTKGDSKG